MSDQPESTNEYPTQKLSETGRYLNAQTPPELATIVKTGRVVGRNKVVIDPSDVQRLAELHVPVADMARFFGVPVDTLTYNFKDVIDISKELTKQRLRKKQIDLALEGNVTLLIWLGKNLLNQQETPEVEIDESDREIKISVKRPKKPEVEKSGT